MNELKDSYDNARRSIDEVRAASQAKSTHNARAPLAQFENEAIKALTPLLTEIFLNPQVTKQSIEDKLDSSVAALTAAAITLAVEELEGLIDKQDNSQDWERANPGYSVGMVTVAVITRRIATLKQLGGAK